MIQKSFTITQPYAGRIIPFYFDFKVNTANSDINVGVAEWYTYVYVSPDSISPITNWYEIQSITVPGVSDIEFDTQDAYELWIPDQSAGPASLMIPAAYSSIRSIKVQTEFGYISYDSDTHGTGNITTRLYNGLGEPSSALDSNTQAFNLDTSIGNPNPPVLNDVIFSVSDGSLAWNPLRIEISLIFRHS